MGRSVYEFLVEGGWMRSCYVSIPFGVKADAEGRMLDFDGLYTTVIRPAVQELDMECRRLDEFPPGAIWHKTLFTAIISSDLMIADISTHNPNVLYELGVRHAMKRGRTLLISAGGRLPWNISYVQALFYEPDSSGRLAGEPASKFREALQATIRQSQRTAISDSPIYEFFPDLEVILPPELEKERRQRRAPSIKARRGFAQSVLESPARAIGELKKNEEEVRSAPQADPIEYLTLLRKYRDLSEWDRVVALANDAPMAVAESPEVRQLLALALNRRGEPGDQDRAIALMEKLIAETGGDSETFGILGRIYKDRYDQAKTRDDSAGAAANLDLALQSYRAGFEKNPQDYYPGINVVTLLLQRDDATSRAELEEVVPRVRAAVQEKLEEKLESGRLDFWELATGLQLAAIARDWPGAERAARLAATQAPSGWMLETTVRDVRAIGEKFADARDRSQLEEILGLLRPADAQAEAADD
jgi:MAP3K TRAFs-binding domain